MVNKVFGDGEQIERQVAERMLNASSFKEILYFNDLTAEDVLVHLIRLGLINTEYFEVELPEEYD